MLPVQSHWAIWTSSIVVFFWKTVTGNLEEIIVAALGHGLYARTELQSDIMVFVQTTSVMSAMMALVFIKSWRARWECKKIKIITGKKVTWERYFRAWFPMMIVMIWGRWWWRWWPVPILLLRWFCETKLNNKKIQSTTDGEKAIHILSCLFDQYALLNLWYSCCFVEQNTNGKEKNQFLIHGVTEISTETGCSSNFSTLQLQQLSATFRSTGQLCTNTNKLSLRRSHDKTSEHWISEVLYEQKQYCDGWLTPSYCQCWFMN